MVIFDVEEQTANTLLSMEPIYALTAAQLFAWMMSKYGFMSYFQILGSALMTMGMLMAFLYNVFAWQHGRAFFVSLCLSYFAGTHFCFAAGFTCLFMTVPTESVSVVNTVNSICFMLGSMVQSWLFGFIADETASYSGSIFMCFVLLAIGLALSGVVHVLDVLEDGPLHKASDAVEHKRIGGVPEDEQYLLNTDDEQSNGQSA